MKFIPLEMRKKLISRGLFNKYLQIIRKEIVVKNGNVDIIWNRG